MKYLMLAILFIPATSLAGIVNVLPQFMDNNEDGFQLKLATSIEWKQGNENILEMDGTLFSAYRVDKHSFYLTLSGEFERDLTCNTMEHLRYRYSVSDLLDIESFIQHEFDEYKALKTRTLIGAGPRLNFKPAEWLNIAIGTAYMFEYQLIDQESAVDSPHEFAHRWSNYLQGVFNIAEYAKLHHTTFVQPCFDCFEDFRVLDENALVLKVNDWLNVAISVRFSYDSRPPKNIKKTDIGIVNSLMFAL
jgi:hypothetical protein